ncbi:MAG: hypothetical protein ACKVY0_16105 [Prosthecobacter sp.]|uniref:hypothetical protein n=1 Tax=Prosthecobacter sp. TaxID=1965333 RepID=UPI0039043BD5
MKLLNIIIGPLFICALLHAADPLQPRKGEVPASGLYVPVSLDGYASDKSGAGFAESHVTVANVPFDLVTKAGADNFFLKSAAWPDWKEDPSKYTADYDKGPAVAGDPQRPMFKVPVADYSAVYLLAACDNDRALSNVVSFRIGAMDGARRVTLHDFSVKVPRFDEAKAAGISTIIATPAGNVFLIKVPLGLAMAQDFTDEWALDVEVTKELQLAVRAPDPCRFNYRPIGPPSGVHVFGMTFARSPVQMKVTSDEVGHVFVEPQKATFHVDLRGVGRVNNKLTLEATATAFDGETVTATTEEFEMAVGVQLRKHMTLPVKRRGYHEVRIRLMNGRTEVLRRETTFAMLPTDTRKHRDESPFGTWDFGGAHFTPSDPDLVGPLYVKAGLRYGMFNYSAEARKKYGVLNGHESKSADLLAKKTADDPLMPQNVLIFHEHAISGPHIIRTPDVFTGRPAYKMDVTEQTKFDAMWKEALDIAKATRAQFPQAKLAFGNGNPHLMEEFARHKFPAELFDSRGNEAGSFMRMPETQPLDFVANNASLWMDRQILDHYGYKDKPITQCYEVCYPSTNPGNLSLKTQASYYVRHMIHSLVWGIPVIRPSCICDVGNSYQFSNWGSCGLCFAKPELSPKPSYVAMATLTRQLDGAKFSRVIETGSPVVYAVEFAKREGGFVTVAWTLRGEQWIKCPNVATALDVMGNDLLTSDIRTTRMTISLSSGNAIAAQTTVALTPDPVFILGEGPLGRVELAKSQRPGDGDTATTKRPVAPQSPKPVVISSLAELTEWQIESEPNTELEWFNFECPRRKGDFEFVEVAEFEGEKQVLSVKPKLPVAGSPHLPMYSELSLRKPIELPGKPTEIGLMVNGNGGWGRIIFELTDASGQRWTSIGAAMKGEATRWMADWMSEKELAAMKTMKVSDWNTNDVWQRSRINFEGWRYLKFPLPGQYDGEGYHWPANCNWKSTGDGVVKYPLRFTKLIIELPEKVLYLNKMIAVPRAEVYLKGLQVTYESPNKVFAAP